MATEEIQISQLELAQEVQGDMVFAVDTATDTKSLSVNQLKNHISQPLQANINAVDTSALHKYNISNCITEIPQDIKLELSNGTLALKAGSKVYVPNGVGVFNTITTESDLTLGPVGTYTGYSLLYVRSDGSALSQGLVSEAISGTTPPSGDGMWYDTETNLIKAYSGGSDIGIRMSFPIARIHRTSGRWDEITQIFNGFGYIGSTVFALPGVKGLTPNGRNADDSLKNIEWTANKVITQTLTFGAQSYYFGALNNNQELAFYGKLVTKYDEKSNIIIDTYPDPDVVRIGWSFFGECTADSNNRITSFTPKTAFHAVDYNDFEKAMLKEDWVKVSTVPASPDSSKFYYIPEN